MSNFKTVKISDERISNCTDKLDVGVFSGPAETTMNKFKANSASASSWTFQVNIPSPNIVIDRNLYVGTTVNFVIKIGPVGVAQADQQPPANKLTGAQIPAGQLCIDIGGSDALQAFPLNQLFTTSSVTINNSATSVQTQSILQALLRSSSAKKLAKYNGGSPALSDRFYLNYTDGVDTAASNVLADVKGFTFADDYVMTRGAHPITITSIVHNTYTYAVANGHPTSANPVVNASLVSAGPQDSWVIGLSTVLYEPLIGLAPFLWEGGSSTHNSMGLYGVNAMSFNFTIDSTLSRFWSACRYPSPSGWSVSLAQANPFTDVFLHMKFLTVQPSDAERMPLKNIVPYTNWTPYISSGNQSFTYDPAYPLAYPQHTLSTITMSLAVVPDLIYIMVRIPQSQMNPFLSSSFFTINSIVCQFNNKSGILSNYSSYDLYNLSVKNGLQDVSYVEWIGGAQLALLPAGVPEPPPGTPAIPAPTNVQNANIGGYLNTAGSLCILSPTDFGLPDFLAPGVSGQYNLQFQISCTSNYDGVYIAGVNMPATMPYTPVYVITPEVVVLVQESGLFITESGQSSVEVAMLSKDDVLDAKSNTEHVPGDSYNDMVAGSIHNRCRSAVGGMHKKSHHHHIRHSEPEYGGAISAGSLKRGSKLKKYIV